MTELLLYPAAIATAYGIHRFLKWHDGYKGRTGDAPRAGLTEYELNEQNPQPTGPDYKSRVLAIVQSCYRDLQKQKAGLAGPWLPSLLDGARMVVVPGEKGRTEVVAVGRDIAPGVALTAVRFTLRELSGSRYSTKVLEEAEGELEEITGAGE